MTKIKETGQYMTSDSLVDEIMKYYEKYNFDNYKENIYKQIIFKNKKIMEPSFGTGNFLIYIVKKILIISFKNKININQIKKNLNNNIFGIEKDKILFDICKQRLNNLLNNNGIDNIEWTNLYNENTLEIFNKFNLKFDYIVGNPPYIRMVNIKNEEKNSLYNFEFSSGIIDLYIIFYEIALKMLNNSGSLCFITPNNFLRNKSQQNMRNYILNNNLLGEIINYQGIKKFNNVGAYTCICILDKNKSQHYFSYKENNFKKIYNKDDLKNIYFNKIWIFKNIDFLNKINKNPYKLSDFIISENGVVTNKNDVFIVKIYEDKQCKTEYFGTNNDKNKIVYIKKYNKISKETNIIPIESKILHRCIKESNFHGIIKNEYIIFPYYYIYDNKYDKQNNAIPVDFKAYNEQQLKDIYPLTYKYLKNNHSELLNRDIRNKNEWYLFGRKQGIKNSWYKKIVFNTMINEKNTTLNTYILDEDIIVYGGIFNYIRPENNIEKNDKKIIFNNQDYNNQLKKLKKIFETEDFANYCKIIGQEKSGKFYNINSKIILDYKITTKIT